MEKIRLVFSCYNEEEKIPLFYNEIKKVMSASWIKDDSFVPLKEMAKDEEGKAKAQQLLTIKGVKLNTVSVRYYPYNLLLILPRSSLHYKQPPHLLLQLYFQNLFFLPKYPSLKYN